jgi:hypothetical protein
MKIREAWYLGKVPEKQNRSWTEGEKMKVYTMMTSAHPAADIARKFKASTIQIYNVVRLVRKGLKDECYMCGEPLTEKEITGNKNRLVKACNKCKRKSVLYKKLLRKKAIKHGLCVYCLSRKAMPGHVSCRSCVSATHRRRYIKGLCGQCGERPIGKNKIALCDECAEKSKAKTTIYRQKIKYQSELAHSKD